MNAPFSRTRKLYSFPQYIRHQRRNKGGIFVSVWLPTKDVADLYGLTERAIRIRLQKGSFRFKVVTNHLNREQYLIDLTSLPTEMQQEYLQKVQSVESAENAHFEDEQKRYTLGELRLIYGEDKMERYLLEAFQRIDWIEQVKALPHGEKGEAIEALCKEKGISKRSLYRWMDDYEKGGLTALMRKPHENRGRSTKLTKPEIMFIRGFYNQSFQPKGSVVYEQYLKKCKQEGWEPISQATMYREIARIPKPEKVLAREGMKALEAKCLPQATRDLELLKVNEIWVGDGHTIAILIPHRNRIKRFTMSAWMDMRSRAMVGWCIGTHGSSQTVGLAVRHGILPKENSPIQGLPGFVYMDNGKEYKNRHLNGGIHHSSRIDFSLEQEGLFKSLDIGTRFALPYNAKAKPIERAFQTFSDRMSRYVLGFCGESPAERPHDLNERDLFISGLTVEQVATIVEGYMNKYNNTPHAGLKGKTPLEVYQSEAKFRYDSVREEELDLLMMKSDKAAILPGGDIKKFGVVFHDEALYNLQGESVTVRYDPNRLDELYVYHNGELHCKAQAKELLPMFATEEQHKELQRRKAKARKATKEALDGYGISAAEARRMVLEDYTDDEEILDIVCGKNIKAKLQSNKVVRFGRATKLASEKKALDEQLEVAAASEASSFFGKMGEAFLQNVK
ncbi:Mu transposase C-terminal domain-containing protein [Paenibacillus melissococcoides]|nr:Mu transposase C-terminal domain-containing protein [Paenibacillus melissococcoides]CAH8714472.1 Mu transposase C-terminal domain-containing protein [Paenibacillus melissococcoides]CAH8715428.1 Mu transposase C-terminal domain-containing protein [Paenibacillus melissococcoides]